MIRISDGKIKKILDLREKGYSINEISQKSGVSKTTVFRYAHSVNILPRFKKRWLERRNASKIISDRQWRSALEKSENLIKSLEDRDLILIGLSLYWAEGAKKDFRLSNTDPSMIKTFIYILRKVFYVEDSRLTVSLRVYEDLNKETCLKFWSKITGIRLDKNTSVEILKGRKEGKLQYGICRVRVKKGGELLKEITSFIRRVNGLVETRV